MPVILATQEAEIRKDRGLKPAQASSSARLYLKKPFKKQGHGFKSQYHKKRKK
jgi:hypothetical protein